MYGLVHDRGKRSVDLGAPASCERMDVARRGIRNLSLNLRVMLAHDMVRCMVRVQMILQACTGSRRSSCSLHADSSQLCNAASIRFVCGPDLPSAFVVVICTTGTWQQCCRANSGTRCLIDTCLLWASSLV